MVTRVCLQEDGPNVLDHLREKKIDLVINLPTHESKRLEDNYAVRRTAVDFGIPLLTNLNLVKLFTSALVYDRKTSKLVGLDPDSLFDFYARETPEEAWWVHASWSVCRLIREWFCTSPPCFFLFFGCRPKRVVSRCPVSAVCRIAGLSRIV